MFRALALSAALATILALSACGSDDDGSAADTGTDPESSSSPSPSPSDGTPEVPGEATDADEVVAAAVADLAEREGADAGEITVASDEAVEWRSGALGCPEAGQMYTQALTPGRRIILTVGGEEFAYHAAATGSASYCETPEEPAAE